MIKKLQNATINLVRNFIKARYSFCNERSKEDAKMYTLNTPKWHIKWPATPKRDIEALELEIASMRDELDALKRKVALLVWAVKRQQDKKNGQ